MNQALNWGYFSTLLQFENLGMIAFFVNRHLSVLCLGIAAHPVWQQI